jgi:hypothetical protein
MRTLRARSAGVRPPSFQRDLDCFPAEHLVLVISPTGGYSTHKFAIA